MIPLATSTAITSAAGAATVDVAPPSYTTWLVQRIEVETEQQAATEQAPEVRVYRSVVHPQMQLASTYQGIRNACEPDADPYHPYWRKLMIRDVVILGPPATRPLTKPERRRRRMRVTMRTR